MSTHPRVPGVDGGDATFANVTAHTPETITRFFELYAALWQQGVIKPELLELTRLRNASITDCGY